MPYVAPYTVTIACNYHLFTHR